MNDRFYSCAKALVATIRAGSMSRAAVELKTTKSAISQKIALFEAELGLTLLDRSGRAVTPTASGRRIVEICAGPIDAALEAESALGLIKGDAIAGRVSVSGPNSLLATIFVPMMQGLRRRYPDVKLELHADDSRTDLAADDIDLALRTGTQSKDGTIAVTLPPTRRALYAAPEFLARLPPLKQPNDLADIPCVLRQQEPPSWSFRNARGKQEAVTPTVGVRVNTMELAHAAVLGGHGIGLLPSLLAQADIDDGAIVSVIPKWLSDPVQLSLLCRAARISAPPVALVRRYILEACGVAQ